MVSAWQQRNRLSVLPRWVGHWRNREGRPPRRKSPGSFVVKDPQKARMTTGPSRNCGAAVSSRASAGESRLRRISMTHREKKARPHSSGHIRARTSIDAHRRRPTDVFFSRRTIVVRPTRVVTSSGHQGWRRTLHSVSRRADRPTIVVVVARVSPRVFSSRRR